MNVKDLEELFQSLVRAVPAYPVTLMSILTNPQRVLKIPRDPFICSPGIFLLFGFILGSFSLKYLVGEMKQGGDMFDGPPTSWLVFAVVFTALIIALQRVLVRWFVQRTTSLNPTIEEDALYL